jgi:limonene-1,2-epoxide hydrolase
MSTHTEIVLSCLKACDGKQMEHLLSFFSQDCVYHNIPMDPVTGPEAVRAVLNAFQQISDRWDWEVHHIAESSTGVVLTERTDRVYAGGQWLEFPTMGAFEIKNGKITHWRDYFDLQQALAMMAKAMP